MKILSTIGLSALFGLAKAQEGCFTSTLALLAAQAFDPKGDDERKVYTICDNAVIKIGIPDIAQADPFSNFVDGDFPLAVIRPNVTVQCSGCVLNGGYLQLATVPRFVFPGAPPFDKGTDNMLVKGFTFTGDLDSFVTPTIAFSAQNILIAGAGNNIVIEDCYFKDINIEGRLVVVGPTLGTGGAAATPPGTIDVTFRNLEFTNVTSSCTCAGEELSGVPVLDCTSQTCSFDSLRFDGIYGASNTVFCDAFTQCSVSDLCISDANLTGAVLGYHDDGSTLEYSGIYQSDDVFASLCPEGLQLTTTLAENTAGSITYTCSEVAFVDACTIVEPTMAPITMAPATTSIAPASTSTIAPVSMMAPEPSAAPSDEEESSNDGACPATTLLVTLFLAFGGSTIFAIMVY
jgi:hypothetical protein